MAWPPCSSNSVSDLKMVVNEYNFDKLLESFVMILFSNTNRQKRSHLERTCLK